MRILVTGGAGFIGSHLVDSLVADGHQVTVIDNLSTGSIKNLPKGITLFERNIVDDLTPVFEKAKPEVVFHIAAQIDVRKSLENPLWDAQQNIIGSLNLLEACKKYKCKRIIFSSSGGAIYGETNKIPTPETHSAVPESPYGIAKLAVEQYMNFYAQVHGLSICILRYGNVYGPRQALKGEAGVVAVFMKSLLRGEQCTIFGDGSQTRDYVYVRDVVDANLVALHKKLEGTFNVGTSVETSVNEVYALIAKELEFPWKAKHIAAIPGELRRSALQTDAIKAHWRPKYTLHLGISETADWFKEHK